MYIMSKVLPDLWWNKICNREVIFENKINDIVNNKIAKFVQDMKKTSQSVRYYTDYRHADYDRACRNIALGKKAEYFVSYCLHKYYDFPKIFPDVKTYYRNKKKWDADLLFSRQCSCFPDIHVKSCSKKTYEYCKDYSWTFQYRNKDGKYGRDRIFIENDQALVALVYIKDEFVVSGTIKAIVPWKYIESVLKDPLNKKFQGLKKCIDFKDLKLTVAATG